LADFVSDFAHAVRWIDDYYRDTRRFPVLARTSPGDIRRSLPVEAPEHPESFEAIFADFERLIVPGITHWNHRPRPNSKTW
jgi:aromatic-L-amino-acid decarboxylase